jgi:hypothetical protein
MESDVPRAKALLLEALPDAADLGDRRGATECLVALAGIAAIEGDDEAAARLEGASQRLFEETGVEPSEVAVRIRTEELSRTRARLGDRAWEAAIEFGRALDLDEAVSLAQACAASTEQQPRESVQRAHG